MEHLYKNGQLINSKVRRTENLRQAYNISEEHYQWLLEKQRGKCAICKNSDGGGRWGRFFIDHDHQTKQVRGLLCIKCNLGLGNFKENILFLQKAIDYLKVQGLANELNEAGIAEPKLFGRKYDPNITARKLNWKKVGLIRLEYKQGRNQTEISKEFGISQVIVSKIVRKKAWVRTDVGKPSKECSFNR